MHVTRRFLAGFRSQPQARIDLAAHPSPARDALAQVVIPPQYDQAAVGAVVAAALPRPLTPTSCLLTAIQATAATPTRSVPLSIRPRRPRPPAGHRRAATHRRMLAPRAGPVRSAATGVVAVVMTEKGRLWFILGSSSSLYYSNALSNVSSDDLNLLDRTAKNSKERRHGQGRK